MKLNFDKKHIAVVGDIILDEYVEGMVNRISPEAPVPVVELKDEKHKPGGAANVAVILAQLGMDVTLFGVIGDDNYGNIIISELNSYNIDTEGIIRDKKRPTTVKTRVISKSHHIIRLDREDRTQIDPITESKVLAILKDKLDKFNGVIIEDYDKGFITNKLIRDLKHSGKKLFVDPKVKNIPLYANVYALKPNKSEFLASIGYRGENINLKEEALWFKKEMISNILLVTMGEQGMLLVTADSVCSIPALKREVYDVTGAGDVVISLFALSDLLGNSPLQSALLSSIGAGLEVTKIGATPIQQDELSRAVHQEWEQLEKQMQCTSF